MGHYDNRRGGVAFSVGAVNRHDGRSGVAFNVGGVSHGKSFGVSGAVIDGGLRALSVGYAEGGPIHHRAPAYARSHHHCGSAQYRVIEVFPVGRPSCGEIKVRNCNTGGTTSVFRR